MHYANPSGQCKILLDSNLTSYTMKIIKHKEDDNLIWFDKETWDNCPNDFFEPEFWQRQHAIVGRSHGRGEVIFFTHHEQSFVLRHYCRGGVIGNWISRDKYLFCGTAFSRCVQEFQLLNRLVEKGLPTSRPAAIRLQRTGLIYSADLITHQIPQALDLSQLLIRQRLSSRIWKKVGAVIRQFHDAGLDHSDLNIHNILLDEQEQVWLIDVDKSRLRKPVRKWQMRNMERLYRSLEKERQRLPNWYWLKSDWVLLVKGYEGHL